MYCGTRLVCNAGNLASRTFCGVRDLTRLGIHRSRSFISRCLGRFFHMRRNNRCQLLQHWSRHLNCGKRSRSFFVLWNEFHVAYKVNDSIHGINVAVGGTVITIGVSANGHG